MFFLPLDECPFTATSTLGKNKALRHKEHLLDNVSLTVDKLLLL